MQKVSTRKLITVGGSVGITLPAKFLKESNMRKGDKVSVVFDDVVVVVKPVTEKKETPNEDT
jgi:antitoxin component of MazEF toxin-antitoxin module